MPEDAADDVEEEVDEVEEGVVKEVMEELVAHMQMGFKSQMSPVTLKTKSGPHSWKIQEQG